MDSHIAEPADTSSASSADNEVPSADASEGQALAVVALVPEKQLASRFKDRA